MTTVQWMSAVPFPVLYSVHASGPKPAPGGSALFCFGFAALRVTVSSYAGPSANAELGTWEPGPLAGCAMCNPSRIREINVTENTTMYQNKVTLIGFLGNDAEVRTNDNRSFTPYRWQPRVPTRRTVSTSRTPSGTVASSSASSESSPARFRRALISRSKVSCAAGNMRLRRSARRQPRRRPSGRSG